MNDIRILLMAKLLELFSWKEKSELNTHKNIHPRNILSEINSGYE
jgi:hypothetical protein